MDYEDIEDFFANNEWIYRWISAPKVLVENNEKMLFFRKDVYQSARRPSDESEIAAIKESEKDLLKYAVFANEQKLTDLDGRRFYIPPGFVHLTGRLPTPEDKIFWEYVHFPGPGKIIERLENGLLYRLKAGQLDEPGLICHLLGSVRIVWPAS